MLFIIIAFHLLKHLCIGLHVCYLIIIIILAILFTDIL